MSDELLLDLARFSDDPLGFVMWAFPWGEPGALSRFEGPEAWQIEVLQSIRAGLPIDKAILEAIVSGNGVGKSALVAWIILWATTTREDTLGVITANTESQLKTKTWAQLGKWFHLFIAKELFHLEATALFSRDPERKFTWRCDMVAWSERNVAAFQGLHNEGKRLFMIFDEASGIPDVIWEAAEGCFTDANTQRLWLVCGNPNNPTGRFRDCFAGGAQAKFWTSHKVDARKVSFVDPAEGERWIEAYGADSDFVRVRLLGEFPRVGGAQFIGPELAAAAAAREAEGQLWDPLVLGVDVARFGDDASVIYIRKGRDGRTHPPIILRGVDTMTLASQVVSTAQALSADAIFVDGTGVGGGVVDRIRSLKFDCFDVQFGSKPQLQTGERYANRRAEIWGQMRDWLGVGAIPVGLGLEAELTGPTYGLTARDEIQLERKEDMKKRGVASPDIADALALTFAYPVQQTSTAGRLGRPPVAPTSLFEYDPFDHAANELEGVNG